MKCLLIILFALIFSCDNLSESKNKTISNGKWNAERIISENKTEKEFFNEYLFENALSPYNNGLELFSKSEMKFMLDGITYGKIITYKIDDGFLKFNKSKFKIANITDSSFELEMNNHINIRFKKFE